jgi:hypothetical protein
MLQKMDYPVTETKHVRRTQINLALVVLVGILVVVFSQLFVAADADTKPAKDTATTLYDYYARQYRDGAVERSPGADTAITLYDYYADQYRNGAAGQSGAADTAYTLYDYYARQYQNDAAERSPGADTATMLYDYYAEPYRNGAAAGNDTLANGISAAN